LNWTRSEKFVSHDPYQNVYLEIFEIDGVTLFNQDVEKDVPIKVKEFKSKIRDANAILIATSEYNYSVPGVLKNAIDRLKTILR
jgi:chromate reductase, NAD(P)H dehydrogenase (quinone)